MIVLIEHCINQALGYAPKALDIAVVKHAAVHALVSGFDFIVEAEVIVHCEMQVEHIVLAALANPLRIKPVPRTFWIAVEPELRARNGTAGHSLLHEGAGHKRDLIEEDAGQRDTLNQRIAGFVAAAKKVVCIRPITDSDDHLIFAPALRYRENALKPGRHMHNHIAA